eukprot:8765958-Pyramimonas_sp.AAC.2
MAALSHRQSSKYNSPCPGCTCFKARPENKNVCSPHSCIASSLPPVYSGLIRPPPLTASVPGLTPVSVSGPARMPVCRLQGRWRWYCHRCRRYWCRRRVMTELAPFSTQRRVARGRKTELGPGMCVGGAPT